jgi:uncharacterized protein (DUF1800 family)
VKPSISTAIGMRHLPALVLFCVAALCEVGCAGNIVTPSILISPATPDVRLGDAPLQFTATITDTKDTVVTWSINGIAGGNATLGTISATGLYTPPAAVPATNVETVQATLTSNSRIMGTGSVTIWNPIAVVTQASPTAIGVGAFTITVVGNDFVNGANVVFGTTTLTTTYISSTELSATGTATSAQDGVVAVTVENPDPGGLDSPTSANVRVSSGQLVTPAAAVRFLEQSTFGPTPDMVTQVEEIGFPAFLTNQFTAPMSTYPDPDSTVTSLTPTQQILFTNALMGPDQLRQRVALALSEIWVTSGFTVPPQGMAPYMRLMQQDAFANYRTNIMYDFTLSPAMGDYLNMVNNDKPTSVIHANENYARELMQLFTIGLNQLNQDGTTQLDSSGNLIPTYNQTEVQAFARAYTGWTYPTAPGATLQKHNPQYWIGPMQALESNHDTASKTLLPVNGTAVTLPAGNSSSADLNGALDNIFAQPSLAPFVCQQLIQHLVSSNPSPAYVSRVVAVFDSGTFSTTGASFGSGQPGDMQAVVAAILLDSEARRGDDPTTANPGDGHLREPILYIANILRAFVSASDGAGPVNYASGLSEGPLSAPSVFNFFPPDYLIPGTSLLGPEFDIETTATTLVRANFVNSFVYNSIGSGTTVSFSPYATLAASPDASGQLLDTLNTLLLHGSMSASTRASILTAVNAVPAGTDQNLQRAQAAIYLILSSSQYQVEY